MQNPTNHDTAFDDLTTLLSKQNDTNESSKLRTLVNGITNINKQIVSQSY